MGANNQETNRVKAVALKMRGRAIEDSIRGAAEALAARVEDAPDHPTPRLTNGHFPFEVALKNQIRAMEARFGALIHDAPFAMVATDPEGTISFVNALARRLFGRGEGELVGAKLSSVVSGPFIEDLQSRGAEKALQELGERAVLGIELTGHRQDGGAFPAEAQFSLIAGSDGPVVCVSVRDVGTARAEHRRLIETERRLRLVFDGLPDTVVAVNARGRITQINSTAETMFGFSRDEIVGKPASRLLPEAVVEQLSAALVAPFAATGETFRVLAARKDGTEFPVEVRLARVDDDRARSAIALIHDASEATDAHELTKVSIAFYRLIVEAAPDAMMVVRASGNIAYANARAEALFGCAAKEMAGRR